MTTTRPVPAWCAAAFVSAASTNPDAEPYPCSSAKCCARRHVSSGNTPGRGGEST